MLLQPSSAAAERVFSVLKDFMGDKQMGNAREDYQETLLMLRVSQRARERARQRP
jgi:hypothetical protein